MTLQLKNQVRILILFMLLFYLPLNLLSQKVILENVQQAKLRGSGLIKNNNKVEGYYFFYLTKEKHKDKKKKRTYILEIYDEDLNKIASDKIYSEKNLVLNEGRSGGKHLLFELYNSRRKKMRYITYNNKGDRLDDYIESAYKNIIETSLHAISSTGFLSYNADILQGFRIQYFNQKNNNWIYKSPAKRKTYETAEFLDASEQVVLILVEKNFRNVLTYQILGLNITTGVKELEIDIGKFSSMISITNGHIDTTNQQIFLFGERYQNSKKGLSAPSTGLFAMALDFKGNLIKEKFISWEKDVSKFVPMDKSGKGKDRNFTFFHKIIRSSDGKIFAIGEEFRKAVDAGSVAVDVIGLLLFGAIPSGQHAKMIIDDLIIYEFSPDFELLDVVVIDKEQKNAAFMLSSLSSPKDLAIQVNNSGLFDCSYVKVSDERESFEIGYLDYHKKEVFFKSYFHKKKVVEKKGILLSTHKESWRKNVYMAKSGYIMVSEYSPEAKKITNQLIKLK